VIHPLWGAVAVVVLVAAFLAGQLLLFRDSSNLNLPKRKPGDPPLTPRWQDDEDDWPDSKRDSTPKE
jgi:hypothetical protein